MVISFYQSALAVRHVMSYMFLKNLP